MTGQHVANQCKQIFSEYGWAETLISYNGPYYTVDAFTSLMNAYHVNHITSSPHYPQSNGLAQKYVQIVKSIFYEANEEGKDLFKCLMIYYNTSCKTDLQDLTSPCLMQLDNILFYSLRSCEQCIRMNICLHMIYILGKMLCFKRLQASSGTQLPLQVYVHSPEVTI